MPPKPLLEGRGVAADSLHMPQDGQRPSCRCSGQGHVRHDPRSICANPLPLAGASHGHPKRGGARHQTRPLCGHPPTKTPSPSLQRPGQPWRNGRAPSPQAMPLLHLSHSPFESNTRTHSCLIRLPQPPHGQLHPPFSKHDPQHHGSDPPQIVYSVQLGWKSSSCITHPGRSRLALRQGLARVKPLWSQHAPRVFLPSF